MATEYRDPATEVVCDNNRKLVVGLGPIQPRLEKYKKKLQLVRKHFPFNRDGLRSFPGWSIRKARIKRFAFTADVLEL